MCPQKPWQYRDGGICATPKRIRTRQMTVAALRLAAQHFKTPNAILFMLDSGGLRTISAFPSLTSTTTTHRSFPPVSSASAFALSATHGDCAMRTSALAQFNSNLLIPFEKRLRGRARRRRRRRRGRRRRIKRSQPGRCLSF